MLHHRQNLIGKRLLYSDLFQTEFGETREGIWLRENCAEFGFIIRYPENKTEITGVRYEPWHLRYVGTEVASYINLRQKVLLVLTSRMVRYNIGC